MSSTVVLPPEIIGKIVEIATDSGNNALALRLCLVSQLFHRSATTRLYHTLYIRGTDRLQKILYRSVPLRPWIASCVRVLILTVCPPDLMNEAFKVFTNLRALRLPVHATLHPENPLPNLRRLHMRTTDIAVHVAQNLTHLYLFGPGYDFISHLMDRKDDFPRLTHFLIMDEFNGMDSQGSVARVLNLLHESLPHRLPDSLAAVVLMFTHVNYSHLRAAPDLPERVRKVLDLDPRVVFWNQDPGMVPIGWNGPRIFDFQSGGRLVEQTLGAIPDGETEIWEQADIWIQNHRK
ncbi:hypothetical protein DL96DRAFT_1613238, partial [Flagelloscypha sp. PMI_526]